MKGSQHDPCGDLPDSGPRPAARRRIRPAAARMASTLRAALVRVTRRLAAGAAQAAAPPPRDTGPAGPLHDEYRAGFPLHLPRQARVTSDAHGCPWCRSLANPAPPERPDPQP
ncbi:hypothetical protein [Streptomyces sp. NPDC054797]